MKDALVIGLGLAGAALSLELKSLGKKITVIDWPKGNSASRIAAGLLNPIVLNKLNPVWKAELFYHTAVSFYQLHQNNLQKDFFKALPVFKVFKSTAEENDWCTMQDSKFLGDCFARPELINLAAQKLKGAVFSGSYQLSVNRYLDSIENSLGAEYRRQKIDIGEIRKEDGFWDYQGEAYRDLFLSIGNHQKDLTGLKLNKGQYLEIETKDLDPCIAIKLQHFIVPTNSGQFKIGAPILQGELNLDLNNEIKKDLVNFTNELGINFKTIHDYVGLRPASKDRRPILGSLENGAYVLNGLGSRGILLAPLLAKKLIAHVYNKEPLWSELDLGRFKK